MRISSGPTAAGLVTAALAFAILAAQPPEARADKLVLKDGRTIYGRVAKLPSLYVKPFARRGNSDAPVPELVWVCDDELRRTYVPRRQIAESTADTDVSNPQKFVVNFQRVAAAGDHIARVGPIIESTPWDDFGRRTVTMQNERGLLDIVVGISEISHTRVKVQGLQVEKRPVVWDQRVALTSIPPETINSVLDKLVSPKSLDQRLKLIQFYIQAARYDEAEKRLDAVIADFPERKENYEGVRRDLRQARANRYLDELKTRRAAGQHDLVFGMLNQFPSEGVSGEILQNVRETIQEYETLRDRRNNVIKHIDELLEKITATDTRQRAAPLRDEIAAQLNLNTLPRMAAFEQFFDDEKLAPDEKLALAFSGWLVGTNGALRNLPVALSLYDTRNIARKYLQSTLPSDREKFFGQFRREEGATPEWMAKLLSNMAPPLDPGIPDQSIPGMFELEVPGITGQPPIRYVVQVPPQYDPLRQYPAIISLHASNGTPEHQLEWWAGGKGEDGMRRGQATRYGYIVVAPAWTEPHQNDYRYSAAEHAAVLNSLRDACRRFSIDTHRVFLTGHSIGGDAAWDIGLAHPDLWAGVIPIIARADRYVTRYWENAKNTPFYFVGGELDGERSAINASTHDRGFRDGYNLTVVEFLGRGHENFSDEILRLFEWMGRYEREFSPEEFKCNTMRPWDNYFWWVELDQSSLPPRTIVMPSQWPGPKSAMPSLTDGKVQAKGNSLLVNTGADRSTIWLSPELVNFAQPISISVNGTKVRGNGQITPDLRVMLEDARTRGDRQHPFWAKVEMPSGVINNGN